MPRCGLPLPVYDPADNRWNLFYVAYQAAPDTSQQWLTNHEGRIWRAVSDTPGVEGIGGPYTDAGVDSPAGSRLRRMGGLAGNGFVLSLQSWRPVVCAVWQRSYREDSHISVASRLGEGPGAWPAPGCVARIGIR